MSCSTGKVQHSTQSSAEAHALSIQQKDGHLPFVYTCKECGSYHVGGGRRSDRPAYLQPHKIPVLPPASLPRKEYTRTRIDGVAWEVKDVVVEYYGTHPATTDKEVAQVFGLDFDKVWGLRRAAGIGTRGQRCEQKILVALQADPSVHRGELSKRLNIPFSMIETKVKQLGFAGTGRGKSQPGSRNPMAGVVMSQESRDKMRDAQVARMTNHPEERVVKKQLLDRIRPLHYTPSPKQRDAFLKGLRAAKEMGQTPEVKAKRGAAIKASWANRTPEEIAAMVMKMKETKSRNPESSEVKAKRSSALKASWASKTPEEKAALNEKRSRETKARAPKKLHAGPHTYWHVKRGIVKADCPLCCSEKAKAAEQGT